MGLVMTMRQTVAIGVVTVGMVGGGMIVATPSQAATVLDPCTIDVAPSRVVLRGDRAVEIKASIASCPAQAMTNDNYLWWAYDNSSSNSQAFTFGYESGAIYPGANLVEKLYSWESGTYTFSPNQEDSFSSPDYSTDYRTAMLTNAPTIVAKLGTATSLKAKRSGKQRTLTLMASRWEAYSSKLQPARSLTLYRNGVKFKTVKLKKGAATITTNKGGKWQARQLEDATYWGSSSATINK